MYEGEPQQSVQPSESSGGLTRYRFWFCPAAEDWDMLDVDEDEKLTGEEEFELLSGPLGLSERRVVPEPVQFPDSDPLGASVAMVTATNSMEETLLQIGNSRG